jgi:hydroxyacylglutathione hydrolase
VGADGDAHAVLTGDSLFVGDAARPDLAVAAHDGAEEMFHSLRRLTELGDGVDVFPGHVAGSLCGAGMSSERSTTIGFEKRFNRALQHGSAVEFAEPHDAPAQLRPPNMERIVALNRGPFLGGPPELPELHESAGATILDVRDAETFGAGHAHGAINVPVDASSFATKAAFLIGADELIVVHAASRDQAERAATALRSVALLDLAGYVTPPPADDRVDAVELEDLQRLLDGGEVQVLDVREKNERDSGYIPGTRHVPYRLLRASAAGVDGERPVVTICNTGARAAIAASVLSAAGVDARPVLHGGVESWTGQKVQFRRCGT